MNKNLLLSIVLLGAVIVALPLLSPSNAKSQSNQAAITTAKALLMVKGSEMCDAVQIAGTSALEARLKGLQLSALQHLDGYKETLFISDAIDLAFDWRDRLDTETASQYIAAYGVAAHADCMHRAEYLIDAELAQVKR